MGWPIREDPGYLKCYDALIRLGFQDKNIKDSSIGLIVGSGLQALILEKLEELQKVKITN